MNGFEWGRKRNNERAELASLTGRYLLTLSIIIALFFTLRSHTDARYLQVSGTTDVYAGKNSAVAEPFGYFMGEWNLWEYIGDCVSSLLP